MNRVVRDSLVTLLARLFSMALGVVSGILVARFLQPEGKGELATLTVVIGTTALAANPGLYAANAHFAAKDRASARALAGNSILWGLTVGAATVLALLAANRAFPRAFGAIGPVPLAVGLLAVPAQVVALCLANVAIGMERFVFYNALENVALLLGFAATVVLLVALGKGVTAVIGVTTAVAWGTATVLAIYVARRAGGRPTVDLRLVGRALRYGAPLWLSALLSYVVIRFDMILVNSYAGPDEAGFYSVSALAVDVLGFLPAALGTVLFPRLSALGDAEKDAVIARATQVLVPLLLAGAAGLAVAFPVLVPWLYGPRFAASIPPLLWLLPGVFFLGLEIPLAASLAARGRVWSLPLFWLPTTALNLGLTVAFVRRWGAVGAAAASSVSYFAIFALVAGYHVRRCGVSAAGLFVPTRESARFALAEARRWLGKGDAGNG
jgi:O-antigen/teichoic acid export membrane protein